MKWFILLLLVAVASCQKNDKKYARTPLGDNIDKASARILHETYILATDTNIVSSPLGVIFLLAIYSSGTQGKMRNEITKLLGETDYIQMTDKYSNLSSEFSTMDSNYLNLANKIYLAEKFTLNKKFEKTALAYEAEVESINFHDTEKAANTINQWANKKLRGIITNPVSRSDLRPDASIALIDLIYFKGRLQEGFEASLTENKDFYTNETTTVKKMMMHYRGTLLFKDDSQLGAKVVELPYQEPGFRMVVILPKEVEGLPEVLEKVARTGLLDYVFGMRTSRSDIDLYLPKFDIKSSLNYAEILPEVGVNEIFSKGAAGVVDNDVVTVSNIFQEAAVRVDEAGSSAGVTGGSNAGPKASDSRASSQAWEFIADRPFLFTILYHDVVVFLGTYTH
ncbi:PREDICTED: antichymotrypsin-1-like [Papilio polytes]|uniref:antichymotrypsin-1-like n=1 Tax=Papilio polytes TaxID=76194 RepID=UPI000675F31D|nr:PREDICTED: antichymotrypsin-1-like [Papilio polytes]